ncbi:MAG: hypothetical protein OQK12_07060 [Motiliproteus sp.]|nr:hypothetical protein [Motiliproteus sp.]MCW9052342.1 hypothetical protein [Motiliproteus sp.]
MHEHNEATTTARALILRRASRAEPLDPEVLLDVEDLAVHALRSYPADLVFELIYEIRNESDLRLLRPLARISYH